MLQALQHPDAVLALGAWAYVVLALAVLADSIIPLIPSELLCVAAGAFVATGRLNGWVVLAAVVVGGMLGDQATYQLGRVGSRRAVRTMTATPRRQRFFERLQGALSRRRTSTIVVARFLPGGRTGVGLLAGMTEQPAGATRRRRCSGSRRGRSTSSAPATWPATPSTASGSRSGSPWP